MDILLRELKRIALGFIFLTVIIGIIVAIILIAHYFTIAFLGILVLFLCWLVGLFITETRSQSKKDAQNPNGF